MKTVIAKSMIANGRHMPQIVLFFGLASIHIDRNGVQAAAIAKRFRYQVPGMICMIGSIRKGAKILAIKIIPDLNGCLSCASARPIIISLVKAKPINSN